MTTMKFLRKLASELKCEVDSLDDDIIEHVLEYVGPTNIELAVKVYNEQEQDQVNP